MDANSRGADTAYRDISHIETFRLKSHIMEFWMHILNNEVLLMIEILQHLLSGKKLKLDLAENKFRSCYVLLYLEIQASDNQTRTVFMITKRPRPVLKELPFGLYLPQWSGHKYPGSPRE